MQADILLGVVCFCCLGLACVFVGRKGGLFTAWKAQWTSMTVILLGLYILFRTEALGKIQGDSIDSVMKTLLMIGVLISIFMGTCTEPQTKEQEEQKEQTTEDENRG